jgi:hypothetical protein
MPSPLLELPSHYQTSPNQGDSQDNRGFPEFYLRPQSIIDMATLVQRENFTYDKLDTTQQSIRVINIDPELSPEGLVQCSIHHTNIDAHYNCLSYRWGSPDFLHTLIVDGRRLSINRSLHEFLTAVRTFTYREPLQLHESHLRDSLWVDAICIDQESRSEKAHQVAQMGKVYSNATKVVMWLGNNHGISSDVLPKTTMVDFVDFVWFNEYWTRAWVAQEVILAKDPVLMIANHLASFPDFVREHIDIQGVKIQGEGDRETRSWLSQDTMYLSTKGVLRAWMRCRDLETYSTKPGITQWLNELRDVSCTLVHDRIFSLLEMAEEGGRIPVDYSMSTSELIHRILKVRDHGVCLCEIHLLNRLLKVEHETLDTSKPCVYAQWKPDSSRRNFGHTSIMNMEATISSEHRKITDGVPKVVRVPLKLVTTYQESVHLCSDATAGKARVPVQLGYGRVRPWQRVPEDEKVEQLHSDLVKALDLAKAL